MSESLGEVLRRAQADGASLDLQLRGGTPSYQLTFGPQAWGVDYRNGDVWGFAALNMGGRHVAVPAHSVKLYSLRYPETKP